PLTIAQEVLNHFVQEFPQTRDMLHRHMTDNNVAELRQALGYLKQGSSVYCFQDVAELAAAAEAKLCGQRSTRCVSRDIVQIIRAMIRIESLAGVGASRATRASAR